MLTPVQLRAQSRALRDAVGREDDMELKRLIAATAFELAQIAEKIEVGARHRATPRPGTSNLRRFILQENIARFERYLDSARDEHDRRAIWEMRVAAQRELAAIEAAAAGIYIAAPPSGRAGLLSGQLHDLLETSSQCYVMVDARDGLRIVDANRAYTRATLTERDAICGKRLFDVFPDNPSERKMGGVGTVLASLRRAMQTGQPSAVPVQRFDVRDPSGQFVQRYWRAVHTPIFDGDERLLYFLHHVQDVTESVKQSRG